MGTEEKNLSHSTRSTLVVSVMTMISRLLGFVRIAMITAVFGAGQQADVINLTFNIPNNLRKLLAEGALSSAFIPVLSESLVRDSSGKQAKNIVRSIMAFQLLILIPLCLLSILFARPLIGVLLSAFREPWQIDLSVKLFRWFINYLLLISVSAVLMGVINSHQRFLVPSITPVLFSVCVIASIALLTPVLGIYSVVAGTLLGGLAQLLFQTPSFLRLGYDFRLSFDFRSPVFRRVLRQWLPVIASSSVFTVTQVIAYRFSSGLEEGSTSALSNAIVFWQLPMGIFSASIITVLFPRMSRQSAADDTPGLSESIQYGIRFLFVFLLPTTVFFLLSGNWMITLALERGEFTAENTAMTARVLGAYSLGLFSVGVFNFLQRFFYSRKNYRIPFYISAFTGVLDVVLSLILKETPLRVIGLALSNTLAFTLGALLFYLFMLKDLKTIDTGKILITFLKVILSSLIMGGFLFGYTRLTAAGWADGTVWFRVLVFGGGALGSILLVLLCYTVLKVEMLRYFIRRKAL